MKTFVILLLMFVAGCGTSNYKKFDLSNVHESQGVIIGKVDVRFNSKPFDFTGCQFCAGTEAGTACHHLLEDGYVFMPVGKGPLTEGRLSCSYPDVCCEDILFSVESFEVGTGIIYFGNLVFTVDDESPQINIIAPVQTAPVTKDLPVDYHTDYQRRKMNGEVTSHVDAFAKDVIDDFASWLVSSDDTKQHVSYKIYFDVSVEDGMKGVMEVFRR